MKIKQVGREPDPAKRLRKAHGANLREARALNGWTLDEVAARMTAEGCRVTPQAISLWERGDTSPRWHHQAALARVYKMTHRALFPMDEVA